MHGLKELLTNEENRLKSIKMIVDDRLADSPEGTLRITSARNKIQYIRCTEETSQRDDNTTAMVTPNPTEDTNASAANRHTTSTTNNQTISAANRHTTSTTNNQTTSAANNRTTSTTNSSLRYKLSYIRKADMPLVQKLAQKSYDKKIQRIVNRRLKQFESLCREYSDDEIDKVYERLHPERQALIKPVEKTWEQQLAEWKAASYVGKEFDDNIPVIYSKKGERVRSKSEKILADILYEMGIDYKYECPLKLKGAGIVYPDFTILRKRDGKEIYWEHDGRMDDPSYAVKAVRKINSYIANGIFPGETLVITYETSKDVLRDTTIMKMIEKHLA